MNQISVRFKGKADALLVKSIVCILGVYYQRHPYAQNKEIKDAVIETIEHVKPLKSNPIFLLKKTRKKSKSLCGKSGIRCEWVTLIFKFHCNKSDLDALSQSGLPVYFNEKTKRYHFTEKVFLRALAFTVDEATAVLACLQGEAL